MLSVRFIIAFVALVLLQVLVLNGILFSGYLNPYIYIALILYMPASSSRVVQLLVAFALGWCIDIFENVGGVHTAATLLLAYSRPLLIKLFTRKQDWEIEDLRIGELPIGTLIGYLLTGIFLHHLVLFALETFRFAEFGILILRALSSSLFTFIFVMIIQFWNYSMRSPNR